MMKKIFLIIGLFLSLVGYAQEPTYNQMRSNYEFKGIRVDSLLLVPKFNDTTSASATNLSLIAGNIIRVKNTFYYRDTSLTKWLSFAANNFDTSKYVKYADTASMLAYYINYGDTSVLFAPFALKTEVNLKLNKSDTSAMLNPYLRKVDTSSLSNRINLRVKYTDTSSMLSPYLKKTDTASLSSRINLRVKYTDTAAMLSPYLRKKDTTSLSSRIDLRVKYTDTSSMLSPYLRKADTTNKWVNRLTRTPGKDSIIYYVGMTRYAIKDSVGGSGNYVDSIYRKLGKDSIYYRRNGIVYQIKDSTGGSTIDTASLSSRINGKADSSIALQKVLNNGNIAYNEEIDLYDTTNGKYRELYLTPNSGNIPLIGMLDTSDRYLVLQTSSAYNTPSIYFQNKAKTQYLLQQDSIGGYIFLPTQSGGLDTLVTLKDVRAKADTGIDLQYVTDNGNYTTNSIVGGGGIWSVEDFWGINSTGDLLINNIQWFGNSSNLYQNSTTQRNWELPDNSGTIMLTSDTTSLSNRINTKLNISDTATMLSPYLKKVDTLSLSNRINLKLNASDTASLSNRINTKLNATDTSSLSNRINLKLNATDTASLSTRINAKQNTLTNPVTGTGTTGAIAKFTGTSTIGDATVDVDYLQQDMSMVAYQAMGSSIKGYNLTVPMLSLINTSYAAIVSGYFLLYPIYIPKTTTITGVKWFQTVAGVYTASNYNGVALYSVSGGTLTRVDSSANDGTIWKATSNTWGSKAFSSTYSAAAGIYYVGMVYSSSAQTTAPGFGATTVGQNISTKNFDFTNSLKLTFFQSAVTTLPSTITASSTNSSSQNVALYLY